MYQKGLSLIELLLAMALIALLLKLSSAAWQPLIEAQRRQVHAEQLIAGLRSARTEAIMQNRDVLIHGLNGEWSQGWRIILDLSGQGLEDPDNPVLIERRIDSQVPIIGNRPVRHSVRFNGIGAPLLESGAFQAGTLHICDARQSISHLQIVLSRTGRASLRRDIGEQALCPGKASEQRADAQLLGHREGDIFFTPEQFVGAGRAPGLQLQDHALHQHFRRRSPGGDANPFNAFEPTALQVFGAVDQIGWGSHALGQLT